MFPNDIIFLTTHVAAASDGAHFPTSLISLAVAAVAAVGAWASQRASSKASTVSTRMDAEKEAYERARKMDTETITRLQNENKELRDLVQNLRGQVELCNQNIQKLQDRFPISLEGLEGLLNERERQEKPGTD